MFTSHRMKLLLQDYIVLKSFTDGIRAPPRVRNRLYHQRWHDKTGLRDLYAFMLTAISTKEDSRENSSRCSWSLVVSASVELVGESDKNQEVARYMLPIQLRVSYARKGDNLLKFEKSRTVLDVWVRMINATVGLEITGDEERYLLEVGDRYVLTSHDCLDQTGHNNLKVRKRRSSSTPWICLILILYTC